MYRVNKDPPLVKLGPIVELTFVGAGRGIGVVNIALPLVTRCRCIAEVSPPGILPHVVVVVYPFVIASEMAVVPICRLLVILVIVVTWLTLIALISTTAYPSNPGTSVSRLAGLKVVSAS